MVAAMKLSDVPSRSAPLNRKKLFRIDINYSGEVHTFHKRALNRDLALDLAVISLAKKLNYTAYYMRNKVRDSHYTVVQVNNNKELTNH